MFFFTLAACRPRNIGKSRLAAEVSGLSAGDRLFVAVGLAAAAASLAGVWAVLAAMGC